MDEANILQAVGDSENTATPKNVEEKGGSTGNTGLTEITGDAGNEAFESLIKGEYRDLFQSKVQKIIDGRFKNYKNLEAENRELSDKLKQFTETGKTIQDGSEQQKNEKIESTVNDEDKIVNKDTDKSTENSDFVKPLFDIEAEMKNTDFANLIKCGIDPETAYTALHFDSVLEGSVKYGAAMAAKRIADNIRSRAARPGENGISATVGTVIKKGASGLTPEKRRELARKTLMGEQIGF